MSTITSPPQRTVEYPTVVLRGVDRDTYETLRANAWNQRTQMTYDQHETKLVRDFRKQL